jgi:hypothetical protein
MTARMATKASMNRRAGVDPNIGWGAGPVRVSRVHAGPVRPAGDAGLRCPRAERRRTVPAVSRDPAAVGWKLQRWRGQLCAGTAAPVLAPERVLERLQRNGRDSLIRPGQRGWVGPAAKRHHRVDPGRGGAACGLAGHPRRQPRPVEVTGASEPDLAAAMVVDSAGPGAPVAVG